MIIIVYDEVTIFVGSSTLIGYGGAIVLTCPASYLLYSCTIGFPFNF